MSEIWETTFAAKQAIWGEAPTLSAERAAASFARHGARDVLIPGIGYGRNAKPFLERGMTVTGIEIAASAIELARTRMGLDLPIHHGSVTDMPFDDRRYDACFCYGLLYLLDAPARAKLLHDCFAQLAPGGRMVLTLIAKSAPMYGQGTRLGEDWYATTPGIQIYFYDAESIARELGPFGLQEQTTIDEPAHGSSTLPFHYVVCTKP